MPSVVAKDSLPRLNLIHGHGDENAGGNGDELEQEKNERQKR